ncbi:MAG: NAD-dependent deacylase [Candidatus Schekmanbacteria bacterium]|nr:MAG: NAD-dependent deacylase [Candidatus Schekmanbacteria bacterium]
MDKEIQKSADFIKNAKKVSALTGAGISAESGIAPFRGNNGIWEKYDPEEYAYIDSFLKDPAKVWQMIKELIDVIFEAKPNKGHLALAEMERLGKLSSIITQNVDGLHQAAGSKRVIEFHGNNMRLLCLKCGKVVKTEKELYKEIPPKCQCGGILRPDVVFFGEPIPQRAITESYAEARSCDIMLVIGTSAIVTPAAEIPVIAKDSGAKIIEINLESTPLTNYIADISIMGKAGEILPEIVKRL